MTTDFREPLQKGGEGVGGDRDEPESGNLKDLDTLSYRSRANGIPNHSVFEKSLIGLPNTSFPTILTSFISIPLMRFHSRNSI